MRGVNLHNTVCSSVEQFPICYVSEQSNVLWAVLFSTYSHALVAQFLLCSSVAVSYVLCSLWHGSLWVGFLGSKVPYVLCSHMERRPYGPRSLVMLEHVWARGGEIEETERLMERPKPSGARGTKEQNREPSSRSVFIFVCGHFHRAEWTSSSWWWTPSGRTTRESRKAKRRTKVRGHQSLKVMAFLYYWYSELSVLFVPT